MKTPADYLNCPVFELTYPTGEVAEAVPVVAYHDALKAIEAALADAEKYKYLLMRAVRRSGAPQHYPAMQALPATAADTPILPLYSPEELAA